MKKRVVSLLLCLIMALSLIPTVAFAAEAEDANAANEIAVLGGHHGGDKHPDGKNWWDWSPPTGDGDSDTSKTMKWDWLNHSYGTAAPTNADNNGLSYVKVGTTTMDRASTSVNVSSVRSNGVTIGINPGYYLSEYTLRCEDKYSCQTAARGNDTHATLSASNKAEVTLDMSKANFSHSNDSTSYWLLLKFDQDDTEYHVTYDWGDLKTTLANIAVPKDSTGYKVSSSVTVMQPSDDAKNEAKKANYEFDGWALDGVKVSGSSFAMPRKDVTLVAQWKPIETPPQNTATLTITKTVTGLTATEQKSISFTITNVQNSADTQTKTIPATGFTSVKGKNNEFIGTVKFENLTVGTTYTVTESNAQVNGYTLSTSTKNLDDSNVKIVATGNNVYFTNAYTPNAGDTGTLTINKTIVGLDKAHDITFIVKDANENTVSAEPIKINATDFKAVDGKTNEFTGSVTVPDLNIGQTYTVAEDTDSAKVDGYTLKTTSTDLDANGKVTVTKEGVSVSFTNTYTENTPGAVTVTIPITKNVTKGATSSSNPGTATFTFNVEVKDGNNWVKLTDYKLTTTGVGKTNGNVSVSIPAKYFDNNTATLRISEVDSGLSYWTYDKTSKTVTVKLDKEKGTTELSGSVSFTNTYTYTYTPPTRPTNPIRRQPTTTTKPVESVKTGDMGIALYAVTSLLSLSGTALVIKKRKDEK